MSDSVSEILESRAAPEPGFSASVSSSITIHVCGLLALFFAHQYLVSHKPPQRQVMTITLGGSAGPRSTGMTAAGARPVDVVAPQPKHEPIRTAASQADVMTLPIKSQPKTTPPPDKALPITAMPKPPTVGAQVQQGTSLAETGATGQDKGLTVGGGGGSLATLEVKDFCCMEYVQSVLQRIEAKWNKNLPGRGEATIKFVIQKDGKVTGILTEKSTGTIYENQSISALTQAVIPPLPAEFKDDHLVIHLRFPYGIQ